mgnify:CR=1 FL=1
MEQNYVETEYDYFHQELMEYLCKGRDAFEDMREEIENSRIFTTPETRHYVEKELKLAEEICQLIEKYWDAE